MTTYKLRHVNLSVSSFNHGLEIYSKITHFVAFINFSFFPFLMLTSTLPLENKHRKDNIYYVLSYDYES